MQVIPTELGHKLPSIPTGDADQEMTYRVPSLLIVDDEPAIGRIFEQLCGSNCDLVLRPDGVSAIDVMTNRPIDVIVSDWRMPGMSGTDFLERAALVQPEAVRILMTGYAGMLVRASLCLRRTES